MAKSTWMETNHPIHAFPAATIAANEDIFDGNPVSDIISLAEATGCVFVIVQNTVAGGGDAVITMHACSDVLASATSAIGFKHRLVTAADTLGAITTTAANFTTSGTSDTMHIIEVDARDLADSGYGYVRMTCTEDTNAAVDGAIFCFLTGVGYKSASVGTQVT